MPEIILVFLLSPVTGCQGEEFPERFIAEPLPGLGNRAGCKGLSLLRMEDEVEFCHHICDGTVTVQTHTHNQPDHKFCGELTFTDTGFIGGIKYLRNPLKGNRTLKAGK
ncbi:hypothetical protein F152LOC_03236 [Pectobacterium brasiliense]|nr:hypothetical protein F152LOC_03888 [Pectobacterium brasiliense]PPE59549.1 hypothetical protein F152LOC_03236 [Pectobacterium brasiliense]